MAVAIGLLIAPSMQHLIAEKRHDTLRLHQATGLFAGSALLPFAISLGLSFYVVFDRLYGTMAALIAGTAFCLLALLFWYGIGPVMKPETKKNPVKEREGRTPLHARIDQMLTEARVILPGAQALLGFQLTVTLTHAFEQLPPSSRLIHVAALISVAFAIILLMNPRGTASHFILRRGYRAVLANRIVVRRCCASTIRNRDRSGCLCGDLKGLGLRLPRNDPSG